MVDSSVVLQILILCTIILYMNLVFLFSAWLVAGIYLLGIGLFVLAHEGDILIGFLWLIDLGVGLIFLTFVVYLFAFLSQRATAEVPVRYLSFSMYFIIFIIYYFALIGFWTADMTHALSSWFFNISWYDYYDIFILDSTTDLLVLRDLYFHSNSFEFFLISFLGLYGIIACVLLTMVIKRSIHYFSKNLYDSFEFIKRPYTSVFIRNQNFLRQRNTTAGSRVWYKKRNATKPTK